MTTTFSSLNSRPLLHDYRQAKTNYMYLGTHQIISAGPLGLLAHASHLLLMLWTSSCADADASYVTAAGRRYGRRTDPRKLREGRGCRRGGMGGTGRAEGQAGNAAGEEADAHGCVAVLTLWMQRPGDGKTYFWRIAGRR